MRNLVLVFLFSLSVFTYTAFASTTNAGDDAYRQGDFASAVDLYKADADQGDAQAAFKLAKMSLEGLIPNRESGDAMRWFTRSCELGKAEACIEVGKYYEFGVNDTGEKIPQDYEKAREYFLKAAQKKEEFGQYKLAYLYAQRVFNDDVEGLKWAMLAERTLQKNCRLYYPLRCKQFKEDIATTITNLTNRMTAEQIAQAKDLVKKQLEHE